MFNLEKVKRRHNCKVCKCQLEKDDWRLSEKNVTHGGRYQTINVCLKCGLEQVKEEKTKIDKLMKKVEDIIEKEGMTRIPQEEIEDTIQRLYDKLKVSKDLSQEELETELNELAKEVFGEEVEEDQIEKAVGDIL